MPKKIITIGFDIPGYCDDYHDYSSDQSLFDADIIVFESNFDSYSANSDYQGKSSYDENESFRLKEDTGHWRSELSTALKEGKSVFVFFGRLEEVFAHTGQKNYEGSGRSYRITNIVSPYDNYQFFPVEIPSICPKGGSEIKFGGNNIFSVFWSEFKKYIRYESYISGGVTEPLFFTKIGGKPVGALFRVGKGNLVLLPPIRFPDRFTKYDKKKEESFWSSEAVKVGKRLIQIFVDIDKALKDESGITPAPKWLGDKDFVVYKGGELKKKIGAITQKIGKLTVEKNELLQKLSREEKIKNLLFENGKPLEHSIIDALYVLGYEAESYNDGELELDSVFISPEEDRYIGEAEGKDNTAINIDKFRQLESNIQEDLQREEISEPAIGVLFGNGFRLTAPEEREEQFTEKCIRNAKRVDAILVRTPDLFKVVKYIKDAGDKKFAGKCRKVIKDARGGIVSFPSVPKSVPEKKQKAKV